MEIFTYSNKGNREVNEDYVVTKDFGNGISLCLVADGMGGYSCGDIASKIVGDVFVEAIESKKSIDECVKLANSKLTKARKDLGVKKMGCTVAGVYMEDMDASVFWAGDSRVYIFRNDDVLFKTEDHSLVNDLKKVKALSFEDEAKYGHIVTRSLMGNNDDNVDIHQIHLEKDDRILICSDGVYNDCPIEYVMETLINSCFDLDKYNYKFDDNHSLIYIVIE